MERFVKIETGIDGRIVMIEPERKVGLDRRVFREIGNGYEWCHFSDWRQNGIRARFYGWISKELPETMRT